MHINRFASCSFVFRERFATVEIEKDEDYPRLFHILTFKLSNIAFKN